jgi:hypothetical protein
MTPESKTRRTLKHAKEKVRAAQKRIAAAPFMAQVMPKLREVSIARLSFINAKTFKQSFGSRSGQSGHRPEQIEANAENASRMFADQVTHATLEA